MKTYRSIGKLIGTGLLLLAVTLLGSGAPAAGAQRLLPSTTGPKVLVQLPSPNVAKETVLTAVSAVDAPGMAIWAVGYASNGAVKLPTVKTVIMTYSGQWTVVRAPNLASANYLQAISVLNGREMWAVGYATDYAQGTDLPLVLHYGSWLPRWELLRVITPTAGQSYRLTGVQALGPDEMVAVGYRYPTGTADYQPFALYYNNGVWSTLNVSALMGNAKLTSVTGTALTDLWATGTYDVVRTGGGQVGMGFIARFNGTTWKTTYETPGVLTSLAINQADPAKMSYAVGHTYEGTNAVTLALHYVAGTGWLRIKTFNPDVDHNFLTQVVASGSAIYALGYAGVKENQTDYHPLVMQYDGYTFNPIPGPVVSYKDCLAGGTIVQGQLWTVGTSQSSSQWGGVRSLTLVAQDITTR